jgi:ribosomal-protein-alanine N-acetyltransferase
MTYLLRLMQLEDIPQVIQIDAASFLTPWSARTYEFEINNRDSSHLVVVEVMNSSSEQSHGLWGMWQRLRRSKAAGSTIVGYGGCWLIAGEAHISTIAVHPDYRGKSLGELLLSGMLLRSIRLGGEYSVLEVRVSNENAQGLYRKYEYQVNGRRRGYYRDNGEDAFLMEARPLDSGYLQRLTERIKQLRQRVDYIDRFTDPE